MFKLITGEQIDPESLTKTEWLVTNGLGGFASGTVSGALTRRYHGLLMAALNPPVERVSLVTRVDEWVRHEGAVYPLFVNRWRAADQPLDPPSGLDSLSRFYLAGRAPTWEFHFGESMLEKQIWMEAERNTTYLRYRYLSGQGGMDFTLKGLLSATELHTLNRISDPYQVEMIPNGVRVYAGPEVPPYYLLSRQAKAVERAIWLRDFYLAVEDYRGMDHLSDHFNGVDFEVSLAPGEEFTLVLTTEERADLDGAAACTRRQARETGLLQASGKETAPEEIRQLVLAADQFIVRRRINGQPGDSILAGYPWFTDWGRDTMISLPGLALVTGRDELGASILRTYARYVDRGMLPNVFPDVGETPQYNTIDATLWYFEAIYQYYSHLSRRDLKAALALVRELYPVLEEIIRYHQAGTRFAIQVDVEDGLLYGGQEGTQLTWMDVKVHGVVVTPRTGKPVEINALWYSALRIMALFGEALEKDAAGYLAAARLALLSFQKFWNPERGVCYDVIGGPAGNDATLRPNQVIAAAVAFSPLSPDQITSLLQVCGEALATPYGLRSLAPDEPHYAGQYGGDLWQRDTAYHQGTVWGWLTGPYLKAQLRAGVPAGQVRAQLWRYLENLQSHGFGSLSEIFDGDRPHHLCGCIAQAWSVAAALEVWDRLGGVQTGKGG